MILHIGTAPHAAHKTSLLLRQRGIVLNCANSVFKQLDDDDEETNVLVSCEKKRVVRMERQRKGINIYKVRILVVQVEGSVDESTSICISFVLRNGIANGGL